MAYKILTLNFGSTSSKIAYFEDERLVWSIQMRNWNGLRISGARNRIGLLPFEISWRNRGFRKRRWI